MLPNPRKGSDNHGEHRSSHGKMNSHPQNKCHYKNQNNSSAYSQQSRCDSTEKTKSWQGKFPHLRLTFYLSCQLFADRAVLKSTYKAYHYQISKSSWKLIVFSLSLTSPFMRSILLLWIFGIFYCVRYFFYFFFCVACFELRYQVYSLKVWLHFVQRINCVDASSPPRVCTCQT